jgi:N-methylhydantoinase A/acetophenone carboxylase
LLDEAVHSAKAEGLECGRLIFVLELDMKYGGQLHVKRIRSPRLRLESTEDACDLIKAFADEYSKTFGPAGIYPEGGISIENFVLNAIYPFKTAGFSSYPLVSSKPSRLSRKGSRKVFWEHSAAYEKTSIYDYHVLSCGNIVEGPAIIEAEHTTFVLPMGARLQIDKYMNNLIEFID